MSGDQKEKTLQILAKCEELLAEVTKGQAETIALLEALRRTAEKREARAQRSRGFLR